MSILQVRNSLFTNESIQYLLRSYEIGEIKKCNLFIRGLNDTYKVVTEENQYIYRIYRSGWRNQSDILYELDAIKHLAENGCDVSTPIKKVDDQWLSEILSPEGLRYGVLFSFTKGRRPDINNENCYLIGKALANIHKLSDSFNSTHKRQFELDMQHLAHEPMSLIIPTLCDLAYGNKRDFLIQVINEISKEILTNKKLEFGFCHGDFHNFNMHLVGKNIEAFDFDCCSTGYRSYDLAVFWWNLKQNYPTMEESCWDQFLNGYLSHRTLGKDNLNLLSKFVTLRRIWFLGTLLRNDDVWGTHWINQENISHTLLQIEKDINQY